MLENPCTHQSPCFESILRFHQFITNSNYRALWLYPSRNSGPCFGDATVSIPKHFSIIYKSWRPISVRASNHTLSNFRALAQPEQSLESNIGKSITVLSSRMQKGMYHLSQPFHVSQVYQSSYLFSKTRQDTTVLEPLLASVPTNISLL